MVACTKPIGQRPPPLPLDVPEEDNCVPSTPLSAKRPRQGNTVGRQFYSCAECRRLKLKCSRVWPCTSCEKRGCPQICPNGQMTTGKGKRLILADTEELHQRISALELALAQSHAMTSATPHPLLASPYLFSPRDSVHRHPRQTPGTGPIEIHNDSDMIDGGHGTLTISAEGEATFVGSFAGSEYLRDVQDSNLDAIQIGFPSPPASATLFSGNSIGIGAMVGPGQPESLPIERLREQLPKWESEGRGLVQTYWENVNWMCQIVPRPMFDTDHLINAYDAEMPVNAHKVACVFLVMALGALFDLNRPSSELFQMGRSCLIIVGLEHATPATVQALHLCGTYLLNDKGGGGGETFWPILGTAIKIAQSLGLHRDGTAFGLSPYEIAERRQVWWEIITYDRLQSLCFGRPCATRNAASDTSLPDGDTEHAADSDGYHRAKYRLITMMEKVIDVQTQTAPVSLQQINLIDKQFREFKVTVPEALLPQMPIQDLPLDPSVHPHLVIHRFGLRLLISQCRLLLNRPLFAMALKENAEDPSQCKFGESFTALYESAQEIVQLVKQLVIYHPSLISRWWFFWFHAFTASVCLGAIAIRSPGCAFASPAFHGMTAVCEISAAAAQGCRAKKGLPVLLRLRQRANEALATAGKAQLSASSPTNQDDDDLSHLASPTRLLRIESPPAKKPSPTSEDRSPQLESSSPQSPRSVATSATLNEQLHYDPIMGTLMPLYPATIDIHPGAVCPPPLEITMPDLSGTWMSAHPSSAMSDGRFTLNAMAHSETPISDETFDFSPSSRPEPLQIERTTMPVQQSVPQYEDPSLGTHFGHLGGYRFLDENNASSMESALIGAENYAEGVDSAFEMFINQMGPGELGIGEAWN